MAGNIYMDPTSLEECQMHSRYSVNIYRMTNILSIIPGEIIYLFTHSISV